MAITTTGHQAPATKRVGLVPSVYDKIILIGADETPLLSMIGTQNVSGITHTWITDTLAKPKHNAKLEISDFTDERKSTKQETLNAVQIFTSEVSVSRTAQAVKTYGGKELEREVAKRAKEHKLDIEYAMFGLGRDSNAKVSVFKEPTRRDESTPAVMAGMFYYIAKGASAWDSAGSIGRRGNVLAFDSTKNWSGSASELTEERLNEVLQTIYNSGAKPKDVFIGANLKAAINKMATRQLGNEKTSNRYLSTLDTDFGVINFHLHRFLNKENGLDDVIIAGDFEYMKNGLLIPTTLNDVPTSKTAIFKRYYTECCLCVLNADAFAIGVGLSPVASKGK